MVREKPTSSRFSLTTLDIALGAERLVQTILKSGSGLDGQAPALLLAAPPPIAPSDEIGAEMFYGGREKSLALAQRYRAVAQKWGCGFFDVASVIAVDPADGIHYSETSHRALGDALAEQVVSGYRPVA